VCGTSNVILEVHWYIVIINLAGFPRYTTVTVGLQRNGIPMLLEDFTNNAVREASSHRTRPNSLAIRKIHHAPMQRGRWMEAGGGGWRWMEVGVVCVVGVLGWG